MNEMHYKKPGQPFIIACVLLLTITIFLPHSSPVFAGKLKDTIDPRYLEQMIDSVYLLLSLEEDSTTGLTMATGIAHAKRIATTLRSYAENYSAKNDILAKVADLESQIVLKQKGLLLEKDLFRQKQADQLAAMLNNELNRTRPDFSRLNSLEQQLRDLNPENATLVRNSITLRAETIAQEAPEKLEHYLVAMHIDSAQKECSYIQTNRHFLNISGATYAELEAKLYSRTTITGERNLIETRLSRIKSALEINDLGSAHQDLLFLTPKLAGLRKNMVSYEWSRYNKDRELYAGKLGRKEDSLIAVAVKMIAAQEIAQTENFLDSLKRRGISRKKIGIAEKMLLDAIIAIKTNGIVKQPVSSHGATTLDPALNAFSTLIQETRSEEDQKNDSLALDKNTQNEMTQVEEVRNSRLLIAQNLKIIREKNRDSENQTLALQELIEIYTKIEQKKIAAAIKQFKKSKGFLERTLSKEDFKKISALIKKYAP